MEKMHNDHKLHEMILHERKMSISEREWKHRLRGYGFGIRDTDEGRFVTSLVRGSDLFKLSGVAV